MLWFNYVASFSDGVQKVGVTSQPFYRLQDHIQEACRHALRVNGFKMTAPSLSKQIALNIKRETCELYRHEAVDGHHDWFVWGTAADRLPAHIPDVYFELFSKHMNDQWDVFNPVKHRLAVWRSYQPLLSFASELGMSGTPIKPAMATELGLRLVSDPSAEDQQWNSVLAATEGLKGPEMSKVFSSFFARRRAIIKASCLAVAV